MSSRRYTTDDAPREWELLDSREVFRAPPWIRVLRESVWLPEGRVVDDYHRIILADCVIVFATTPDGRVLLERQYKHGAMGVGLSLPAGAIDEGEDPLSAAKRELLEETGYQAEDWRPLGAYAVNGNYGCGRAHLFTAQAARKVAEPDSGDLEEMQIVLMPKEELVAALLEGRIQLLGAVAAIALGLLALKR